MQSDFSLSLPFIYIYITGMHILFFHPSFDTPTCQAQENKEVNESKLCPLLTIRCIRGSLTLYRHYHSCFLKWYSESPSPCVALPSPHTHTHHREEIRYLLLRLYTFHNQNFSGSDSKLQRANASLLCSKYIYI